MRTQLIFVLLVMVTSITFGQTKYALTEVQFVDNRKTEDKITDLQCYSDSYVLENLDSDNSTIVFTIFDDSGRNTHTFIGNRTESVKEYEFEIDGVMLTMHYIVHYGHYDLDNGKLLSVCLVNIIHFEDGIRSNPVSFQSWDVYLQGFDGVYTDDPIVGFSFRSF